jgi:hypothetical protein
MSKRVGTLVTVAVVAIVGAAAFVAQAGSDPAELDCGGGYEAIGFSQPSKDSLFESPTEAATAFLADMEKLEGKAIPADVALVDVTTDSASGSKVLAAQVDGKTIAVLHINQVEGGWAVDQDLSC